MILGIDEVGRGPWAGPLVVGAVILDANIEGLTDSKKLSKRKREILYDKIMEQAAAVGIGWVTATEIDGAGLAEALRLACRRAVKEVQAQQVTFHEIIIDGTQNLLHDTALSKYVTTMKKADLLVPTVSAASIVAKVARDEYMTKQNELYPGYGFASHVGYGTAEHKKALLSLGSTPLHRRSFAPVADIPDSKNNPAKQKKDTTETGNQSETVACDWLAGSGYQIIARNWKVKLCEIDIVAEKEGVLTFVEVKHRNNAKSGDGLSAITARKLGQMKFAANMYVHWHDLYGKSLRLAAIATSGDVPKVDRFLEIE